MFYDLFSENDELRSPLSAISHFEGGQRYVLLVAVVLCFLALRSVSSLRRHASGIPSVGNMWLGGLVAIRKNCDMVVEGYKRYPDGIFKIPMFPFGTMVVVNGTKLTDEIRTGSNASFSFDGFFDKMAAASYTIDPEVIRNPYHISIIQTTLTRNLGLLFGDLIDEMEQAFDDILPLSANEWQSVCVFDVIGNITARTSNRVVVGAPLCSKKEFYHDVHEFAVAVMTQAHLINIFPEWTHPLAARLIAKPNVYVKRLEKYVGPLIEQRWANLHMYGKKWAEKPNDYLMWLMEAAPGDKQPTTRHLVKELLMFNFAAIHTTGMALTHVLYHLGEHTEYIEPLRDEAESVIAEHGWTKASMQKMYKLDSFLRESARLNPTSLIGLVRQVLKDYTFSDGTTVKKGTWISASSYSVHMDKRKYENATEFKPWRFSDMREESNEESTKHQYVVTSNEYLAFGAGKHACPGRFFAANELKAMLAHIVLNYDIKFEQHSAVRPENIFIGSAIVPNSTAKMLMRRRLGAKTAM